MRKWATWTKVVVVVTGLAVSSMAWGAEDAEPPAKKTSNGTWFPFLSGSATRADKKAPARSEREVEPDPTMAPPAAHRDEAATERAREQQTLYRRLAVCDKLREIAVRQNDDRLMQQADQLDERCWQIYLRRIEQMPAGPAAGDDRAPELRTAARGTEAPTGKPKLAIGK